MAKTTVWAMKNKLVDSNCLKRINYGKETALGKGRSHRPKRLWEIKGRSMKLARAKESKKDGASKKSQNSQKFFLIESNPQAPRVGS